MICEIIEEPKGDCYKKLVKYAINKSDTLMFTIRRDRYIYSANYKVIKIISHILNLEIKELEINYMYYIENRFEELYKNFRIIFSEEIEELEILCKLRKIKMRELIKERLILSIEAEIEGRKDYLIQDKHTKKIKGELKKHLVKEKHDSKWTVNKVCIKNEKENNQYLFDICFYKICPEIERFLLESVNSLYGFNPPYLPEDIAFYKDGYCWFYTVTHEERAEMNLESIEECNDIENIGIKIEKCETSEKYNDLYEEYS